MSNLAPEKGMPRDAFLIYLSHFANAGPDHPIIQTALQELGLAECQLFTGAQMRAVELAVATLVQSGLDSSEDPKIKTYARIMRDAQAMMARHLRA
ncbi:MAG TPA: hypothetical protein V6D47_17550 [Oscillatoriaceae cyanobacterium]